MLIDQPQKMVFWKVIVKLEVVEQRFRTDLLPHHDRQASEGEHRAVHGRNDSLYRDLPANQSDFFNTHRRLHLRLGQRR